MNLEEHGLQDVGRDKSPSYMLCRNDMAVLVDEGDEGRHILVGYMQYRTGMGFGLGLEGREE